jgi:hypothetical protein
MLAFFDTSSGSALGTRPRPIDQANPVPRAGDRVKLVGADGEFAVSKVVWAFDTGMVYVHLAWSLGRDDTPSS